MPPKFPLAHLSSLRLYSAHKPADHLLSTKLSPATGSRPETEQRYSPFLIHMTQCPVPQPVLGQETKKKKRRRRRLGCGVMIQLPGTRCLFSRENPSAYITDTVWIQGEKIQNCTTVSQQISWKSSKTYYEFLLVNVTKDMDFMLLSQGAMHCTHLKYNASCIDPKGLHRTNN